MGTENTFRAWSFKAKSDLSSMVAGTGVIHKAVDNYTGNIAAAGALAFGLLKFGADSGGHVSAGFDGLMKYTSALAVSTPGMELSVTTSGYLTLATSGTWSVGKALEAVTSGSVGMGVFNFTTPIFLIA